MNDYPVIDLAIIAEFNNIPQQPNDGSYNFTTKVVNPCILRVQKRILKQFLGREFYADYVAKIQEDPIPALILAIQPYVNEAMAYYSYAELHLDGAVHLTPGGVVQFRAEYSESPDPKLLTKKLASLESAGSTALGDLEAYLDENEQDYPLWKNHCKIRRSPINSMGFA
jgi:hypothetical protein